MRLTDWTVIQNKDEVFRRYIYGDIKEYKEECKENEEFDIIEFKDWTADDCRNLISNLLEDINKHYMTDMIDIIKSSMDVMYMDEVNQNKFMQHFTIKMFERYGY